MEGSGCGICHEMFDVGVDETMMNYDDSGGH